MIEFELKDMLIPSEWINSEETNKCYLAMFANTNAKDISAFYFGQMYLQKYYTYFDLNGVQSGETDKLLIGTGLRKDDINILELQYNKSYQGYQENNMDQSSWTYLPNPMTEKPSNIIEFIKRNMVLFIVCCIVLAFLVGVLIGLCIYLRKKSQKNRISGMFKDKLTYYGKKDTKTNTRVQQMDLSISLDQDDSGKLVDRQGNPID